MNFDFWSQEWPIIEGAPHIALGGAVVIILVMFAIFTWAYRREIADLKAENGIQKAKISALNERLRLAGDEQKSLTGHIHRLITQINKQKELIEVNAAIPVLASSTATISGTIGDLALANLGLGSTLGG